MQNIKQIKSELLEAAAGKPPSASHVAQDDIMDMMLKEYFNPQSRAPKEIALQALGAGVSMMWDMPESGGDAVASIEKGKQVAKAILAKYEK